MLSGKHVFTQLPLQLPTLLCGAVADVIMKTVITVKTVFRPGRTTKC